MSQKFDTELESAFPIFSWTDLDVEMKVQFNA